MRDWGRLMIGSRSRLNTARRHSWTSQSSVRALRICIGESLDDSHIMASNCLSRVICRERPAHDSIIRNRRVGRVRRTKWLGSHPPVHRAFGIERRFVPDMFFTVPETPCSRIASDASSMSFWGT